MTLMLTRRGALGAGFGLLAATMASRATAAAQGFFASRQQPLGVQLYTLGDMWRTDLEGTLARLAKIGYRTIEIPGLQAGAAARMRAAADKFGLSVTSVHALAQPQGGSSDMTLETAPGQLAAEMHALGARDLVMPMPLTPSNFKPAPGENVGAAWVRSFGEAGADHWKRQAEFLNARGKDLAREGVHLNYHNHNLEFAPVADGMTGWDVLVANTDPKLVSFEVDIGWVSAAGIEPVAFLQRHAGRVRQVHVKDVLPTTPANFKFRMESTEVGSGRIDWKTVLPAAYAVGVRQFYVEQEPPFKMDRFDAVAQSFAYLMKEI